MKPIQSISTLVLLFLIVPAALAQEGRLLVAEKAEKKLAVFNGTTGELIAAIPVGPCCTTTFIG